MKAASCVLLLLACGSAAAKEDIEYVAEHLPEVAMDNRYATLPVWGSGDSAGSADDSWSFTAQAAYSRIRTGSLELSGPLLSLALESQLNDRWALRGLLFYDDLQFTGNRDARPLQTLFSPATPIDRPVAAVFTNLDGSARDYGFGASASLHSTKGWLGEHCWVAGVLWQKVELRDYRFDYRITDGPSTGVTGQIDFDTDYTHVTPFVGLELPRHFGQWSLTPHALFAFPWPRRGIVGHITGPGFDLRGNTEDVGAGKHFGDPSLTLGLDVTYRPWRLTVDLGTTLTQRLLEPQIHDGIHQNWVISAQFRY